MARYKEMTDEELKELAKQRVKRTGSFKKTALRAQEELYKRHHWGTSDSRYIKDDYADRSIEDVQYNG